MMQSELPPELAAIENDVDFAAKTGPLPTSWDEVRKFPRFYYRARVPVTIYPLAANAGPAEQCTVLTRDLSRGGLKLLHREQLYPGQKIDLALTEGALRRVEVTWCRQLAVGCYSAGCRFIQIESAAGDTLAAAPPNDV